MVGDFSFSDVAHNLHQLTQYIGGLSPASTRIFGHAFYLALLANAEYWWAVASFHSHFRSCILFSFIYYHYLEIFGAQILGLGFLKSSLKLGYNKNAQVSVSNFETGVSRSSKVQSYHSISLLLHFLYITYCADRV